MRFLILLCAFLLSLCGQADAQQCIQCMAAQPKAADCIAGYQWTYANGFWRCAKPVPPAPTCPAGYDQRTAPTWNGSVWVGLVCDPQTPPPPATGSVGYMYGNIWCHQDGITGPYFFWTNTDRVVVITTTSGSTFYYYDLGIPAGYANNPDGLQALYSNPNSASAGAELLRAPARDMSGRASFEFPGCVITTDNWG
ncbi:hypothetical protein SAMN05443245_7413 [Paraburkholderia fungorum]|uniref:Uncharacterized protein n=1 Tax=Paraburkholderia fungorum TaxID=134537 RepID=A0A1H1JWM5_9BURK|nr:hypothetical protein SAMN05443245_7413 [Paraburkholderia fungorum]